MLSLHMSKISTLLVNFWIMHIASSQVHFMNKVNPISIFNKVTVVDKAYFYRLF